MENQYSLSFLDSADMFGASAVCMRCPLHSIMGQIAETSLRQHILFLEGECLPRVESLGNLERLMALVKQVSGCVCVASRTQRLTADELARLLATLRDPDLRVAVTACAEADTVCPLDALA